MLMMGIAHSIPRNGTFNEWRLVFINRRFYDLCGIFYFIKRNVLIQSEGASENEGFRLYNTEEGSILEVDDIVWRNQPDPSVVYSEQLRESDIYSQHNNVIQKVINTQEIQDDKFKVKCVLKYNNSYQAGQYIYIYLSEDQTQYIIQLGIGLEDGVYVILAKLLEDKVAPELISIEVTYDDGSRTTVLNIQKGENSGQSQVSISNTGTIDKAKYWQDLKYKV